VLDELDHGYLCLTSILASLYTHSHRLGLQARYHQNHQISETGSVGLESVKLDIKKESVQLADEGIYMSWLWMWETNFSHLKSTSVLSRKMERGILGTEGEYLCSVHGTSLMSVSWSRRGR
jgi:hypothetical protein